MFGSSAKFSLPPYRRRGRPRKRGRPRGSFFKPINRPGRPVYRPSLYDQFLELPPEIKNTVAAILIIATAVIIFLSLLNLAGRFGQILIEYLGLALGIGLWVLPFILIILAYFLIRPQAAKNTGLVYVGAILLILSFNGLAHLLGQNQNLWEAAKKGVGGGLVGLVLSWPLLKFLGFFAGLVVMLAMFFISLFLFFRLSLTKIGAIFISGKNLLRAINNFFIKQRIKKMTASDEAAQPPLFKARELEVDMELEESSLDKSEKTENGERSGVTAPTELTDSEANKLSLAIKKPAKKIDLPLSLLNGQAGEPTSGDIKASQYVIAKTLKNFGIEVEMGEVNVGPTVTQYTLKPAEGVKLSRIVSLSDNLALALAAHPIRMEAPIPGRSLVGIEVPNRKTAIVPLREVLDCPEFKQRTSNLLIALGKDVKGQPHLADFAKMPHLLICGATGSGKSVCVNAIIISLLFQNGPDQLKFIMVDPKRVELPIYNGIPHLLTPVITEVKKTINALRWTIGEMENRFDILSESHRRDIKSYNLGRAEKMPYIIIVIDELADLMAAAGPEIEGGIIRLAQMARAVGIHLVIATQRPSVDVLTGLIKANITSRIAFSVASLVDSRTILDMSGAEKLLGRGDMLFTSAEIAKPRRLQGAYASDEEIKRVADYLRQRAEPTYLEEIIQKPGGGTERVIDLGVTEEESDPLLEDSKEIILQAGKASASLLQRRLRIGYARAARILDLLEERGFIGPVDGAKPREILQRSPDLETLDGAAKNSEFENEE